MNLREAQDHVKALLTHHGVGQTDRISAGLIDSVLNASMEQHFEYLKFEKVYWHSLVTQGQDEYQLPDGLIGVSMIKVAGERYYPAAFPFVEDAKRVATDRTRVTEEGTEVSAVVDRWYWLRRYMLQIYPEPEEDTPTDTSGSCTVSGSTVTVTSGSLGTTNSLKRMLALVGSNYFVILSNDGDEFSVDGTPSSSATTYEVYNPGLQIWGTMRPSELTEDSDDLPGSYVDQMAVVLQTAYIVALMLPNKQGININGLADTYQKFRKQSKQTEMNRTFTPKNVQPFTFRSDHAGYK